MGGKIRALKEQLEVLSEQKDTVSLIAELLIDGWSTGIHITNTIEYELEVKDFKVDLWVRPQIDEKYIIDRIEEFKDDIVEKLKHRGITKEVLDNVIKDLKAGRYEIKANVYATEVSDMNVATFTPGDKIDIDTTKKRIYVDINKT